MKIAITSTGNSMESSIDPRFGRCAWFVFYDTETGGVEFVPNPNRNIEEGAGPASLQMVAARNVEKIVSGEFGNRFKTLIDSLKIQMIVLKDHTKKISEIIEMLNHKK
jgi:predicted Fe-Mo cluster-binding NifX family protein